VLTPSFQGFRSVVENSPDAITVVNVRKVILYMSSSITSLLGYEPRELVGRNCLELVHPEDHDAVNRALETALLDPQKPVKWDSRVRGRDGSYSWIETVSSLLNDLEVRGIVMHQRDINERRLAEAERQRHADEMARSNVRLEEFAYMVAHDLREPLRAIAACTEMFVQRTPLDATSKQMAAFITTGVSRMSTLVTDLLSFTTTGLHQPSQPVDLRNAVSQAMQNLELEIRASEATVIVEEMPIVPSNEIQLVRVFQNLISNAIKYRGDDALEIGIRAERAGPNWVLQIEDNGLGIATEDQVPIFMPFKRLPNRDVPGSGLGLAVCKRIIEGLGGTIWVRSELRSGSTFMFTVTAAEPE
jgi:PAS domain S-box-containing protein